MAAVSRGCSSGVERSLRMRDVLGSIPSISTHFYFLSKLWPHANIGPTETVRIMVAQIWADFLRTLESAYCYHSYWVHQSPILFGAFFNKQANL